MMIFLYKLIKQPLLWAFLIMISLEYGAYRVFDSKDQAPVLAAISTGLVVMFGYFATHYLTIERKQKERKFEQCLELIKKIRFFILEGDIKGEQQQFEMRDELQDAYFAFSLLTSAKSYEALSEMMKAFETLLSNRSQSKLREFTKAQSNFVNQLRKDFFIDKDIDFKTYDFRLKKKGEEESKTSDNSC
ncbi:hypothetical protein H8E77_32935 [bacterium]|nr:hypothetical protein [bacterium]